MAIRTLVLSGGGGRGAFHAGVYKYLQEENKPNVDDAHKGAWTPDIVVGTSIGAVNGAAIAQGVSAKALEHFWLNLEERDIQGLPPGMGWLARFVANRILSKAIGTSLKHITQNHMSPAAEESWPPLPIMPAWISSRLVGRWSNLLDTAPLRDTLRRELGIDENKVNNSKIALLISATNVRTGEGVIFSNQPVFNPKTGELRDDIKPRITINRILASCSIPMVYPWTVDTEDTDENGQHPVYWDGAVVQNTPLAPAFDVVNERPKDEPMESVVVMMTPWREDGKVDPHPSMKDNLETDPTLPGGFGEAITWTLDWALLASFRRDLKMAKIFNRLAEADEAAGRPPEYRKMHHVVVAPEEFLAVERIIDYDLESSRDLIKQGYDAAKTAFETQFPA